MKLSGIEYTSIVVVRELEGKERGLAISVRQAIRVAYGFAPSPSSVYTITTTTPEPSFNTTIFLIDVCLRVDVAAVEAAVDVLLPLDSPDSLAYSHTSLLSERIASVPPDMVRCVGDL